MERNNVPERSKFGTREKVIAVLSLVLILSLVVGVRSYYRSVLIQENNLILSSQQVNLQMKESIAAFVTRFEDLANTLASDGNISRYVSTQDNASQILGTFNEIRKNQPEVMNVYFGVADGKMILSPQNPLPKEYDPTSRPWYQEAMAKGALIWTDPYTDASSGNIIVSCAQPTYDVKKNLVGVIGIDLDLTNLVKKLNAIQIDKKAYNMITDKNGIVVISKDSLVVGRPIGAKGLADGMYANTAVIRYISEGSAGKNDSKIAIVTKVEKLDWHIISVIDVVDWK